MQHPNPAIMLDDDVVYDSGSLTLVEQKGNNAIYRWTVRNPSNVEVRVCVRACVLAGRGGCGGAMSLHENTQNRCYVDSLTLVGPELGLLLLMQWHSLCRACRGAVYHNSQETMPVGTSRCIHSPECLDIIVYIACRKPSGFQRRNLLLVAADAPHYRRVGSQQQSTPPLLQHSVPTRRGTHWYAPWQSRWSSKAPQARRCMRGGGGVTCGGTL